MSLTAAQIRDLVLGTLRNLGPPRFHQIATKLPRYEVFPKILKKDKVQITGGTGWKRSLMLDHNYSARHLGMFATLTPSTPEVMAEISVDWRHTESNWNIERREILMNRGSREQVFKLITSRRAGGTLSMVEKVEECFWSKPATSADQTTPWGLEIYVVFDGGADGHTGGDPAGFPAGAANLTVAAAPRWRNYQFTYTDVSQSDLIRRMRTCHRQIRFQSPIDLEGYRRGTGKTMRIYVNDAVMGQFEELAESRNENLGPDVGRIDETVVFKKHPIIYVPALDLDHISGAGRPVNPIYFIDYDCLFPIILEGDFLHEQEFKGSNQPNVTTHVQDLTWNLACYDRRGLAVGATGLTA